MESRKIENTEQVWKKNDRKAQKNGSHANIYWVRVKIK
jgi:hypothetical protein